MEQSSISQESLRDLARDLKQETFDLVRQEIKLAKTEISEKVSCFGRNAAALIIGGFVAYAGVIALFIGLGFLLSMWFVHMGMDRALADFAGLGIVGLIIALAGIAFVTSSVKSFSNQSLAPERTLSTLRELKGESTLDKAQFGPQDNRTSEQIEAHIETTRSRMEETASEIKYRLTPGYMRRKVVSQAKSHPAITAAVGFGTGLASFIVLRRRRNSKCS
jgi:hypothetical protein